MIKSLILVATTTAVSTVIQAACPTGTVAYEVKLDNKNTCLLNQMVYKDDLYLTNSNNYVIEGGVFIGYDNGNVNELDPATLTIDPGTTIYALNPKKNLRLPESQRVDRKDFLVISRGSKIYAQGTKENPIVFTSAQGAHIDDGKARPSKERGDWGGLFIDGMAKSNKCADKNNCTLEGEAGTGFYGGYKPDDDSGILRYVRVEYGGDQINEEKQYNGITFNTVGSATIVEYIQVHKNDDDGIEFFGGSVNAKYVYITGASDDSVDWTDGYTGMLQYVAVVQDSDKADRGIEGDSNSKNFDAVPRSFPTISNMTLIGSAAGTEGLKLRKGTGAIITNSVVMNFAKACVESSDSYNGTQLFNNVFACEKLGTANNFPENTVLKSDELMLDGLMPQPNSPLLGKGVIPDDFDEFIEDTDFIGAFGSENWLEDWTVN